MYLSRLQATEGAALADAAADLRAAVRGDCHSHTDASDGGSPLPEMVETARDLGHEYLVITDHSPRLTVANGLSPERLRAQLRDVAELNEALVDTGFRVLTGIEVDILDDGSLDQEPDLLAELDVVVASVHSKLRMPAAEMTERMLTAVANPHVDVLGHCTGRMVTGNRKRPESQFDADAVFAACAEHGVAVEINSRPERLDPPKRLLRAGRRRGVPVHDRHRRARAGPARLARRRVRACRGLRGAGGAGAEHVAGRAAARASALSAGTRSGTRNSPYRDAQLAGQQTRNSRSGARRRRARSRRSRSRGRRRTSPARGRCRSAGRSATWRRGPAAVDGRRPGDGPRRPCGALPTPPVRSSIGDPRVPAPQLRGADAVPAGDVVEQVEDRRRARPRAARCVDGDGRGPGAAVPPAFRVRGEVEGGGEGGNGHADNPFATPDRVAGVASGRRYRWNVPRGGAHSARHEQARR